MTTTLLATLTDLLGPDAVLTGDDAQGHLTDWSGRFTGAALAVVRPASTQQVADVVRACVAAAVAVVPQGGLTGLVGGAVPAPGTDAVVVSLTRMRRIRELDAVAGTVVADAGVVLADLREAVDAAGWQFPISLGSEGTATIGGIVSTNAGGTAVLRHGMTRDLVLGLEVVLPDGRTWHGLRTLRKDNTGYDLKQLFVGAEGTLGIVTAAALRLVPATPHRATALVALPDIASAVDLLTILRTHAGDRVTAWEVMSHTAFDLVLTHLPGARSPFDRAHAWYGLVEIAGTEVSVTDQLEAALGEAMEGPATDAVVASAGAQTDRLWALREGISEAQRVEGLSIKHDVTLPIDALADFVEVTALRLDEALPGVRLVTYGHIGDGNLHHNLSGPPGDDGALREHAAQLTAVVYDEVTARGGSISAEHGVGVLKREAVARTKDPVEIDLMRTVKRALDPQGMCNPGKVIV